MRQEVGDHEREVIERKACRAAGEHRRSPAPHWPSRAACGVGPSGPGSPPVRACATCGWFPSRRHSARPVRRWAQTSAISARTAGVARTMGWMTCISASSAQGTHASAQSVRRGPLSPTLPDPNNVPLSDSPAERVVHLGRSHPCEYPSCSGPVPTAKTTLYPEERHLQKGRPCIMSRD